MKEKRLIVTSASSPQEEPTKTTCLKVKLFSPPLTPAPARCLEPLCTEGASQLLPKYHSPSPSKPVILDSSDGDETVPVPGRRARRGTVDRASASERRLSNGPINAAKIGGGGVDVRTQQLVNEFLDAYRSRNLRPATIDWYRNILGRFARTCPTFPDGPQPIESFLASIKGSDETIYGYFRALKTFFKFTAERRETATPMAKVRVKRPEEKLPATLEEKELYQLLTSATTLRDRAILTLFVDSGIRSGELAGLRVQNIRAEVIKVRGKTGEREVPISEETHRLLEALMASQPNQEYVFLGHKGPLCRHGIYRIVRLHMTKAGITGPKLGPHRIRHGFGKNFLVSGGDLRSLQLLMGHKRITTTEIYTHLVTKDLIEKHHKFSPLRAAQAAAQESLWKDEAVEEAESILTKKGKNEET